MPHYLLTGAGFSRNWGGWLANEVFEYLLGSTHVDDLVRQRMWAARERKLGFEDLLAELQASYDASFSAPVEQDLRNMTSAVTAMFAEMGNAFDQSNFQTPHIQTIETIASFLNRFDAIYTLNQDTLIEQKYDGRAQDSRFLQCLRPGLQMAGEALEVGNRRVSLSTPLDEARFSIPMGHQPYIKLHGSFDWITGREVMLIIGGNKPRAIEQHPILRWYHRLFSEDLHRENARLMVIGYSFNDQHINDVILSAAQKNLRLFIVDPLGVDVLDKRNPAAQIPQPLREAPLLQALSPTVIGASRRSLISTFSNDAVEYAKLLRFFR